MLVYGGYRFPEEGGYFEDREIIEESGRGVGVENDVILYPFESGVWEVLDTTAASMTSREEDMRSGEANGSFVEIPLLPAPRYGHSAVIYSVCLFEWSLGTNFKQLFSCVSGLHVCVWWQSLSLRDHHDRVLETQPNLPGVDTPLQCVHATLRQLH